MRWWRDLGKAHLGRRRRQELAGHGLALSPSKKPEREVLLGEAIRALREAWREPPDWRPPPASAKRRPKRERGAITVTAGAGEEAS